VQDLLRVENISKTYSLASVMRRSKKIHALRDVSFTLAKGEIVGLVGESGCGKSTLGKVLLRTEQAQAGKMWLKGVDVFQSEPGKASFAFRSQVQMILQDPFASLNPVHTVAYHLERPLLRHGICTKANVRAQIKVLLEQVGLTPVEEMIDAYPYALSGGQRQRVAIARALAVNPEMIIADEPTSMLDVSIRMDILNLLEKLRRERQVSILLITHDLASARYLTDRIIVLFNGQIVEMGPTEDIIQAPSHPYTKLLLEASAHPTSAAERGTTIIGNAKHTMQLDWAGGRPEEASALTAQGNRLVRTKI